MKIATKLATMAGFLLWKGYWTYVFFSAPVLDEQMRGVVALFMAVFLPLLLLTPWILMRALRRLNIWLASTRR